MSATPTTPRKVLGVHFIPCNLYAHMRPLPNGEGYAGRCARCGHTVKVKAAAHGAKVNFLQAKCPLPY